MPAFPSPPASAPDEGRLSAAELRFERRRRKTGLVLGPAAFALLLAFPPPSLGTGAGTLLASAASFAVGAALPVLAVALVPRSGLVPTMVAMTLVLLAALGGLAARVGGASVAIGAGRVTFWGAVAMAVTAAAGALFGGVG